MYENAIRLLKQYRQGIVKQMLILGKHDNYDTYLKVPSIIEIEDRIHQKRSDWSIVKEKLKEVDEEIFLLENL